MFRFTIRELVLVTVIVALIVASFVQYGRLNAAAAEATQWKFRAQTLSNEFHDKGYFVKWDDGSVSVFDKPPPVTFKSP